MTTNTHTATVDEMKAAILRFLSTRGNDVSFIEMENLIPGFKGDECSWHVGDTNMVIWPYLSITSAEAMFSLKKEGLVDIDPCDSLVYFIDGDVPSLPVAKVPPKNGYTKPHWVPCVVVLTPAGKAALKQHDRQQAA